MKKLLIFLSISLFFSLFTTNFASAANKSGTSTSYRTTLSGLSVYGFNFYLRYAEEYKSVSTTDNSVTYRDVYFSMDKKTPSITFAGSGTTIYNGNTKVWESGAFSQYYPDQIVPANSQVRNFRNSVAKNVKKGTGKSTNTSSLTIQCSQYAPCVFNQSVTLSY